MKPEDYGISIPNDADEELFREGFAQGMSSSTLHVFKKSYRYGFRAARLLQKRIRAKSGIANFPLQGKIKVKSQGR